MKKTHLLSIAIILLLSSCIALENDPLVTVNPTMDFNAHIRKDSVYVTANIFANPTFVDPGGIPSIFYFTGELEMYNEESGQLLGFTAITGNGLNTLVEVSSKSESFEHIIVIAKGIVSAYADKGSDGDTANDLFMHESDFYDLVYLKDILNLEGYPVVTLDPEIDYQMYFNNKQLVTTATISANPNYIVAGNIPVIYNFDGVLQVSDEDSGALLKSASINENGLSVAISILTDTASYKNFVILVSGTLTAKADLGSDGDPSNDLFITSTEFYDVNNLDLSQF